MSLAFILTLILCHPFQVQFLGILKNILLFYKNTRKTCNKWSMYTCGSSLGYQLPGMLGNALDLSCFPMA